MKPINIETGDWQPPDDHQPLIIDGSPVIAYISYFNDRFAENGGYALSEDRYGG
ncbi:hypothetical protein [Desulfonema ishimotonii]|uniref:hypothetical protein n=1 Tax=Desulfonema ishimotonii TaxID=45657 RepID=UPI00140B5B98|nr:hypothetical protein [Desulfonema ishimotonii]